ncbi:thiamine-phosphate kinase [Egbenema bharatensis]|uniref:thiamine-phosphate kinase n=1 Tax=Egbenema bharatensis TaxID=3463334 RepID=UPI003A84B593
MSQEPHQEEQVQDLGEQEILKRLYTFCPIDVVGDDAALLSLSPGHCLVVTTDMLVDQVHFSDHTTHPSDVGWRAATANLSDLAAMGAEPLGITVSLGLPGTLPITWVEELYRGLTDCLNQYQTAIVGGDVCRSSVTTVSITAFGQVHPSRILKRANAKPGQVILVTGVHGASRAGLELLLHPEKGQTLDQISRDRLIQAHQRPCPRLDVISLMRQVMTSGEWGVGNGEWGSEIAAMDSSDGLADAVVQICRASGVGAVLERDRLPISADLNALVAEGEISEAEAIDWVLYGGEDFELVICLPPAMAEAVMSQLGEDAAIVGRITENQDMILSDPTGTYSDDRLGLERGFQHFQ